MSRASVFLRVAVGAATLLGLRAVVMQPAVAATRPKVGATTWSSIVSPLPSSSDGTVSTVGAIACPTPAFCVVVGNYNTPGNDIPGFADTYSDGKWTAKELPLPANGVPEGLNEVNTVACPAAGTCIAAGIYYDTSSNQEGLIETLSGGRWSAKEAPLPGNASTPQHAWLGNVACAAVGSCVVTGLYDTSGDQGTIFTDTLIGRTWRAEQSPVPANVGPSPKGVEDPQLNAITCPSTGSCVAIGSYVDSAGSTLGLIETLSNGTWSAEEAPVPANAGSGPDLNAISCPSVGSCVAVGNYFEAPNLYPELIETLAGGMWSAREAPVPPALALGGELGSISCPVVGSCVAVGGISNGSGLIETLSNGAWTGTKAPSDPGYGVLLVSVDCLATGSCVAVGSYDTRNGGPSVGVIDTLSSGTWSATTAPLPSGDSGESLLLGGVTCSGSSCFATGTTGRGGGGTGFIEEGPL